MIKRFLLVITTLMATLFLVSCGPKYEYVEGKINITTTTNIMADLAKQIGGDEVAVYSLMGAGVDPHGYEARPSDLTAMDKADFLLVNGLHLEGKMVAAIASFSSDKTVLQIGDAIAEYTKKNDKDLYEKFIVDEPDEDGEKAFPGKYDPHYWFDIDLYKVGAQLLADALIKDYPEHTDYFANNLQTHLDDLDILKIEVIEKLKVLDLKDRLLVSSHDAFEYFGNMYDFDVWALQGLSTEDEATLDDIEEIITIIIDNGVKAVFPETSVSSDTIRSVQEGVKDRNRDYDIIIGEDLYSDSIGDEEGVDDTYILMYKKNVQTILNGLAK